MGFQKEPLPSSDNSGGKRNLCFPFVGNKLQLAGHLLLAFVVAMGLPTVLRPWHLVGIRVEEMAISLTKLPAAIETCVSTKHLSAKRHIAQMGPLAGRRSPRGLAWIRLENIPGIKGCHGTTQGESPQSCPQSQASASPSHSLTSA